MGVFQCRGVFLTRFSGFSRNDLRSIFLLFEGFDLAFQNGLALVEFIDGLFGFLQFSS